MTRCDIAILCCFALGILGGWILRELKEVGKNLTKKSKQPIVKVLDFKERSEDYETL